MKEPCSGPPLLGGCITTARLQWIGIVPITAVQLVAFARLFEKCETCGHWRARLQLVN